MAYMVRTYVDVCWVGEGMGPAGLGTNMSNSPGYGASATPGQMPNAQTMRFQAAEMVPGTFDAPTAANIGTAITSTATDIQGQITAAIIAQIDAWATGGP